CLLDRPQSPTSEAVRSLRGMLLARPRKAHGAATLFASAAAGEGKTFCAINCAAAMAVDGRRTLLIDADLRSPAIGARLFRNQAAQGLAEVLLGKAEFENAIQPSRLDNLFVLTAGSPTEMPSELIGSEKMSELLKKAVTSYDHVIIDTPAVLDASDAIRIIN